VGNLDLKGNAVKEEGRERERDVNKPRQNSVWAITREEKRKWYSNLLDHGAGKGRVEGKTEE
jgi:hypothetical protein